MRFIDTDGIIWSDIEVDPEEAVEYYGMTVLPDDDDTNLPVYALASQDSTSEQLFPGRYSDLAAAWGSAEWRNAHYPRTCTYVIDTRTGERAPRAGVERPMFESDADIEDYYRVRDDDEMTPRRAF